MEELSFFQNKFSGSLNLRKLPSCLRTLNAPVNRLSGQLCLTMLPASLREMSLRDNLFFCGTLDLTQLPPHMQYLWLNGNSFHGEVDLTSIPTGMIQLRLNNNNLAGVITIGDIPSTLTEICIEGNTELKDFIFVGKDAVAFNDKWKAVIELGLM